MPNSLEIPKAAELAELESLAAQLEVVLVASSKLEPNLRLKVVMEYPFFLLLPEDLLGGRLAMLGEFLEAKALLRAAIAMGSDLPPAAARRRRNASSADCARLGLAARALGSRLLECGLIPAGVELEIERARGECWLRPSGLFGGRLERLGDVRTAFAKIEALSDLLPPGGQFVERSVDEVERLRGRDLEGELRELERWADSISGELRDLALLSGSGSLSLERIGAEYYLRGEKSEFIPLCGPLGAFPAAVKYLEGVFSVLTWLRFGFEMCPPGAEREQYEAEYRRRLVGLMEAGKLQSLRVVPWPLLLDLNSRSFCKSFEAKLVECSTGFQGRFLGQEFQLLMSWHVDVAQGVDEFECAMEEIGEMLVTLGVFIEGEEVKFLRLQAKSLFLPSSFFGAPDWLDEFDGIGDRIRGMCSILSLLLYGCDTRGQEGSVMSEVNDLMMERRRALIAAASRGELRPIQVLPPGLGVEFRKVGEDAFSLRMVDLATGTSGAIVSSGFEVIADGRQ